MPLTIPGVCVRDASDDFPCTVNLNRTGVFDVSAVTAGTLAVSSPTGLTLGAVTVAANVCTFRVSGGLAGTKYLVTLTATNGTDTLERCVLFDTR